MAGPKDLWRNIKGTVSSFFHIGKRGPQWKNNSGVIEAKNFADSAYAKVRGATPVDDNDLVTKYYADSLEKPLIVKRQADCSVSLPNNTGVRGWVVVTTAGSGAVIGDILYDDGSGSGTMTIVPAVEGRTLAITDSLSGGTISFDPDSVYIWDSDGSSWIKIGDIGSVTGAVREIRKVIDNSASQDTTTQIPANARVTHCSIETTTAYSAGATISVGNTATADLFMDTGQNDPEDNEEYFTVDQDTDQGGSATVARVTIGGAPAAGAGVMIVRFTAPLA